MEYESLKFKFSEGLNLMLARGEKIGSENKRVFVHAGTDEKSPSVCTPFVLCIDGVDSYMLAYVVVVAESDVVQVVVVKFNTGSKLSRHEEEARKISDILSADYTNKVFCFAVSVLVHSAAIIAVSSCVLHGSEKESTV